MSNLSPEEIGQLALRFAPEGMLKAPVPFGGGHINDTYLFSPAGEKGVRYVLQRINRTAFPHPEDVMDNMLRVTQHLREQIVLRATRSAKPCACCARRTAFSMPWTATGTTGAPTAL